MPEGTDIMGTNGWEQYKRMFLDDRKRSLDDRERRRTWEGSVDIKLNNIVIEVTKLKMKSSVWGAIGGAILFMPVLIYMLIK